MKRHILTALIASTFLFTGCNGCSSHKAQHPDTTQFITTEGTKLLKQGKPYHFVGCNMWYASILGSTGMGGDRERLCRELDMLKELGVTNVRILSGPDAGSDLANPAKPYLQVAPGVLNDTILEGLDYTLAELEKRDMEAVIYLNKEDMTVTWITAPISRATQWHNNSTTDTSNKSCRAATPLRAVPIAKSPPSWPGSYAMSLAPLPRTTRSNLHNG